MTNEFKSRRNRWGGFIGRPLITLVLVFSMIISTPFFSNAADTVDAGRKCSLTVKAANENEFPDLADAALVIDLYQVAKAVFNTDGDGYTYELLEPYKELKIEQDLTAEQWRKLSQSAAAIALDVPNGTGNIEPAKTGAANKEIGSLDAGLYLLIARSDDIDKYVTTTRDGTIVTKASSGSDSYIFLPELVSLPTKEPDVNGEVTGEWIYGMTVYLKPEKDTAYGSLIIGKILERYYVNSGPATFVFDVEAKLDGKTVYSNVVSIVFDGAGKKELRIDNIPVGADVTVTEVYSGACYTVKGLGTQTVVITADIDNPASVQFDNDYDDRLNGGSGITNHFKYNETNGWNWEQVKDRSQG